MKVRFAPQADKKGVPASPSVLAPLGALGGFHWLRHGSSTSRILILAAFFLISSAAWAFPQFKIQDQYVGFNKTFNQDRGVEEFTDFFAGSYLNKADFAGQFNTFFTYQYSLNSQDITLVVDVWPEICQIEKAGVSFGGMSTYHLLDFSSYCQEHDFLIEPFVRYTGKSNWFVQLSVGGELKLSRLKYFDLYYTEWFPSFKLETAKVFKNNFEISWFCANHDEYRYYVFPSPVFRHGFAYNWDRVKLYLNWQIHCCDMFTSKFYLNGRQIGAGVIIKL